MNWNDLSSTQKTLAIGAGVLVVFGSGFFTGGAATVKRHRRVLTKAQAGYKENAGLLKRAAKALSRVKEAERQIKKAASRGRLGRFTLGDVEHWRARRMAEKAVLRQLIYELRDRLDTMTDKQERKLRRLEAATADALHSAVERTAVLGVA